MVLTLHRRGLLEKNKKSFQTIQGIPTMTINLRLGVLHGPGYTTQGTTFCFHVL